MNTNNAYNHFQLQITMASSVYILPVACCRLELLHARPENLGAVGFDSELASSQYRFVWLKVDQKNTFEAVRHVRKCVSYKRLLLRKLCWIRINPNFIPNVWPLQTLDSRFVRYVIASRCRSFLAPSRLLDLDWQRENPGISIAMSCYITIQSPWCWSIYLHLSHFYGQFCR